MKIMCLKGWGGKLCNELLPYVETAAPDILCLQEVVNSPDSKKDWLNYRDGDHILPQLANFFRDFSNIVILSAEKFKSHIFSNNGFGMEIFL